MTLVRSVTLRPKADEPRQYEHETKFLFHYKTTANCKNFTFFDDSKLLSNGNPIETIYGRKFKLQIWEECLATMGKGEVRQLYVKDDPATHDVCLNYVATAKCLRKFYKVKTDELSVGQQDHGSCEHGDAASQIGHSCSLSIQNQPYKDLRELIKNPPEIFEFQIELVDTLSPGEYVKDIWQMSDDEKLGMISVFREQGNSKFLEKDYVNAADFYTKGLSAIESLMLKEKPKDVDWCNLDAMKTPFLLNLSQVKLSQHEYYDCISYADEVLKRDKYNVKALFRRAKAHSKAWNFDAATTDFNRCLELDPSLKMTISNCLQELRQNINSKNTKDRATYGNMFPLM